MRCVSPTLRFLRAFGQRWLTHSHVLNRNLQAYHRHLVVCCCTERGFTDDSCLSCFGSQESEFDYLRYAQRCFAAQTLLDLLNSERAARFFRSHVQCLWTVKLRDAWAHLEGNGSINANLSSNGSVVVDLVWLPNRRSFILHCLVFKLIINNQLFE